MITQADIIYFVVTDRFKNSSIKDEDSNTFPNLQHYYGGDFAGIKEKIPYLKELGINALWITPVYLNVGRNGESDSYHGYWSLDFEKVDHHLNSGTKKQSKGDFKNLVKELKQHGIKVILDMVVNHTGYHNDTYNDYHKTALDSKPEDHLPFNPAWFNQGGQGDVKGELSGLPDLNHDNIDVRDYFVNNIVDWIEETGIDAIRMDTVKHVEKSFWHAFKTYVRGKYRNITLIGEVLTPDAAAVAEYQTKMDFDSLFDFPLQQTIMATFVNEGPMTWLARPRINENETKGVLDIDTQLYNNANRLVTLLDNHDLNSRIKTAIFDHIGHWDRFLCDKMLKLSLAFLFTTRGIPQVYYGTEIGMEGGKDPYNRGIFRWDYFAGSNQTNEAKEGRGLFEFVKQIIKIRTENDCLQFGYLLTLYVDHYIYAYMREYRGEVIIVVLNNGRGDMLLPLTINISKNSNIPFRIKDLCKGKQVVNLLNTNDKYPPVNSDLTIQLKGKECKILKLQS